MSVTDLAGYRSEIIDNFNTSSCRTKEMTQPVRGVQRKWEKEMSRSNSINAHFLKVTGPSGVLGLFFVVVLLCKFYGQLHIRSAPLKLKRSPSSHTNEYKILLTLCCSKNSYQNIPFPSAGLYGT